ncbi:MAG: hypothetical protein ACOCY7_00230 [Halodesulfurarchaeum sp.]
MCDTGPLSCEAKLARVILENRGPLSPAELAAEGNLSRESARVAMDELQSLGMAQAVCGLTDTREEVVALTEAGAENDAAAV